jgi:hypothetical protein
MSYSKFIARLVTQRRGLVWSAVALIAALSLYVLVTRLTLDTEVSTSFRENSSRSRAASLQ